MRVKKKEKKMASSTTVRSSRDPEYSRVVDRVENFASSNPDTTENRYFARISLIPLADSIIFIQKQLRFAPAQEIKVGRLSASRNQRESRPDNGVFDCDVMSREHAILKEDGGKVLLLLLLLFLIAYNMSGFKIFFSF